MSYMLAVDSVFKKLRVGVLLERHDLAFGSLTRECAFFGAATVMLGKT